MNTVAKNVVGVGVSLMKRRRPQLQLLHLRAFEIMYILTSYFAIVCLNQLVSYDKAWKWIFKC